MADDDTSIDPRFDPAFQRGFEGTVGVTPRRRPIGSPSVVPAQEAAARPTAPTVVPPIQPVPDPLDEPAVAVAVAAASADATDEPDDARRRVNPFLLALVVIGIALIALGLWGAMFANTVFQSDTLSSSISYVTVLLAISGSTVALGLGVGTLIGIVFLHAASYRRRRA